MPIRHRVKHKVYGAVFNGGNRIGIHGDIFEAAGLVREPNDAVCGGICAYNASARTPKVHWRALEYDDVLALQRDVCFTFATEPHFDSKKYPEPTNLIVDSVREYVEDGGNFLAQCTAIESYENCDDAHNNCAGVTCDPNYHDWYVIHKN